MLKRLIELFCLLVLVMRVNAQSYGLQFNSHESVLEKRTALILAPGDSLKFNKSVRLDFDLNFVGGHQVYFGYVVRILNDKQNIDVMFDQLGSKFKIVFGSRFSGISFAIDSLSLYYSWNKISVVLDPVQQHIVLYANGKNVGTAKIPLNSQYYRFLFGANDVDHYQTRDIPPMRIKDIRLFNGNEQRYYWPLNEVNGSTSSDSIGQVNSFIKNPVWIRPLHQHWSSIGSFSIKGNAIASFDAKSETIYISGSDSVISYSVTTPNAIWKLQPIERANIILGSQGLFDSMSGRFYNIFIDKKNVAVYKPGSKSWTGGMKDTVLTAFWHANKFLSRYDTSIYVIGGYGWLKYKNSVQRYSLNSNRWDTLHFNDNVFSPRYLAALGATASGDSAYIIGGYGSKTGDQMLDPEVYTDMYVFDVRRKTFKKLFELNSDDFRYTFANSLVIDEKSQRYYGLVFSNRSFNSSLQVIEGSLKEPVFKLMGDKIPYSFYDVQSFADLYYAPHAGKLIAVTFFYSGFDSLSKHTDVKVYSLDFPPIEEANPLVSSKEHSRTNLFLIFAALFAGGVLFFYIILNRRRRKKLSLQKSMTVQQQDAPVKIAEPVFTGSQVIHKSNVETEEEHEAVYVNTTVDNHVSSVLLFGQFQVFDKAGEDITELFSPLIKELFLLVLIYTFRNGRGINSEELNEILWTNKSVKDAKNNRSVNMAKLKGILEKVGNCSLVKKSNFWQFQTTDDVVFVDYCKFIDLVKEKPDVVNKHYIMQLLQITGKGSFLSQTEYDWLDDVKADISNAVIDISLSYLAHESNSHDDPEFVIEIANWIFQFDRLNEDALEYKCKVLIYLKRHELANKTYTRFSKDYKEMCGEEFKKTFSDITKNNSFPQNA
ncbi:kelch repeat-containing protein [Chitinophagaceae bacterium 26-R-25]|nr:kelch repeat-containing protein [Chitinophagaceae bacterium 26-R-25]